MSLIRHLLVIAILFGASVTSGASAQGSSLARSDRASTTSSVPAEVLVRSPKAAVQFLPLDDDLVPAEAQADPW
jgi:hypothetical protein